MKINKMLIIISAIVIVFSLFGCDATQQPYNLDQPGPLATSTPASSTFIVTAIILAMGGSPGGLVTLSNGPNPVTGATVIVNGVTFTDTNNGGYNGNFTTLFAAGDTVTLSVTSSAGNATATGTVPAAGTVNTIPVTGAMTGSTMSISF